MLRKIDCVMVRVDALEAAEAFYTKVFGLQPLWRDESAVGMALPETDAEVVLHTMDLPADLNVYFLVDDVAAAVAAYERGGCVVRTSPFDVAIGRCAVLEDPFGNSLCVIDLSKGPRQPI
ncbi:VOC family protein [Paractinoplanes maris]|uniref:VOC family protein n=1 Tax=Paractinoplanes maris TaxID=1734446 RepID=UPI002020FEE0|nr:VOC family protein [Actinoplanes maris]